MAGEANAASVPDTGFPNALLGLVIPHGICTLFILARLAARLLVLRKWFVDDTLIVFSFLASTGVCVVYSIAAQTPDVLHADEPALQEGLGKNWGVHPYILRTYLGLLFYQITLCLTKLSILTFYLRVFASRAKERRLVWCTILFVLLYGVPMLLMSVLQCHPSPGHFFGRPMACFGFQNLLIASATFHAVTDVWLLLLILPCISGLDIPSKQKVVLSIVLNLGIFVVAAGVVRLMLSVREDWRPDLVGATAALAFFVMTILECDLAIICASAPTLRPLLARMYPWIMADPRRRSMRPLVPAMPAAPTAVRSENLTAVSYRGYPWTEPGTPELGRSRNGSVGSGLNKLTKTRKGAPRPPMPAVALVGMRTPTSLSLRSMVGGMSAGATANRSRLGMGDDRPILDVSRRASEVSGHLEGDAECLEMGLERPRALGDRWSRSEESLVVGLNDPLAPASPKSPTSVYRGRAYLYRPASGEQERQGDQV
ncbi:hypothetical protein VD0004_g302 [Verticillium dahliae]|uniref:Rhodopsin domain-containing protein n=1 Tax=Verticillium dahliae TaxID=27337 RepID=A0A444RSG0_VERDA|nr:hypothetical protein VD0004_g302 [Verticillium dahliae]PNH77290.1 hypothetical protein VD0001_g200 [Verticillium dahliae]RXG44110.1 hypothetical protein VDGE_07354 [Verticillium dahliae]